MENSIKKINLWTEWIMHLFLLQLYWLAGTLIGGVIFGIVPSTLALFSSIRRLFMKTKDLKLFDYFIQEYKSNFKVGLVLNLWYVLMGFIVFVYIHFLKATTDTALAYTHFFMYIILLFLLLLSLYLIPVYIHYEVRLRHLIPTASAILLTNIKWIIPHILSLLAIKLIFLRFSVVILFFGVSGPAFLISYFTQRAFSDFDLKREQI